MNQNEVALINMIRESEDPGRALVIAAGVILTYLKQRGSSEEPFPAAPSGLGGTN